MFGSHLGIEGVKDGSSGPERPSGEQDVRVVLGILAEGEDGQQRRPVANGALRKVGVVEDELEVGQVAQLLQQEVLDAFAARRKTAWLRPEQLTRDHL